MEAVNLFQLATTQAKWLSLRQTTVANNIANAHAPAYRPMDVEPFEAIVANRSVSIGATAASHFGTQPGEPSMRIVDTGGPDVSASGNRVSMEQELVKSSEIRHAFEINTAIVSSFHRMILMTAKP
ncbi:flagellar basal body rod protein FlgB [Oricola cellulosilytica]|uniref:Flagellar basal body rod protein FlgB n=1 Tax=Oricola cellulosilytica TaxID=1429082 RepID=A0A4R0PEG1_9HYPH|nr:flagellar basal body rod protein FlgB [Oricola cellulosilytica]TCD16195.1 flagellar basal body rod protein FlgB [Oricola cellulosilytica]